jgi:hypothetical protein
MGLDELENLDIDPVLRGGREVVGVISPASLIWVVLSVVRYGYVTHDCSFCLVIAMSYYTTNRANCKGALLMKKENQGKL